MCHFTMAAKVALASLLFTTSAAAGTVTLDFDLDDLNFSPFNVRYEQFGPTVNDRETDTGVINFQTALPAFDAATHGQLEKVTVSIDYSLSAAVFARYTGADNLADPDAQVTGAFQLSDDVFVFGVPPGQPGTTLFRDNMDRGTFDVSTDTCTVDVNSFGCTTRDAVTISRPGPVVLEFTGQDLDAFRGTHRFGVIFSGERLDYTSTVTDRFATGFFADGQASPFFQSSAAFSITYQTTPILLPASLGLLGGAVTALVFSARRRASACKTAG